ncbi:acetyl-coenzyme A synthetase N-terminal domain-containing protein, partial [Allosediminivita pacifica]
MRRRHDRGGDFMTQPSAAQAASDKTYAPSDEIVRNAHVDAARYEELYKQSVEDPEGFWGEQAKRL